MKEWPRVACISEKSLVISEIYDTLKRTRVRSRFPYNFNKTHHTSLRRGDAFERESAICPLEQLAPIVLIAFAAVKASGHYKVHVS